MAKEYYTLLEIEETATEIEIKKAYRKKALEFHPDRNPGNKEAEIKFKKINEAYSVLSNPEKKANYDRFGSAEGMGGFGGSGFGGGFDPSDLGDIFSSFFGGGFSSGNSRTRRRADIGADIQIKMKISLEDSIQGVSRKISYEQTSPCYDCNGKGGKTKTCEKCGGRGTIIERTQTIFGTMEQSRSCPNCGGTGEEITETCKSCNGKGKKSTKKERTIEVPKGIENGMSIKMRDEGHIGNDGNGDLYITFSVPNEEGGLVRKGADLHYIVKISPAEATIGTNTTINIPIIGKKELSIKAGTQHNTEIIFKNEGFDRLDRIGSTGNLIISLYIEVPTKLTSDQKKLYEALLKSEGGKPKKGWLEEIFGG